MKTKSSLSREAETVLLEYAYKAFFSTGKEYTPRSLMDIDASVDRDDLVSELYGRLDTADEVIKHLIRLIINNETEVPLFKLVEKSYEEVEQLYDTVRKKFKITKDPLFKIVQYAKKHVESGTYNYIQPRHLDVFQNIEALPLNREKESFQLKVLKGMADDSCVLMTENRLMKHYRDIKKSKKIGK